MRQEALALAGLAAAAAVLHLGRKKKRQQPEGAATGVIFTGTGCSTGLPMIRCTLSGRRADGSSCDTCRLALRNGRADPNWRNNVGVLLRFRRADGTCGLVQVDVGKTFRESMITCYRAHGVEEIDAVLLTHNHADAVNGLDELRTLQRFDRVTRECTDPMQCLCDRRTMASLRAAVPYLCPPPASTKPATPAAITFGAAANGACCPGCGAADVPRSRADSLHDLERACSCTPSPDQVSNPDQVAPPPPPPAAAPAIKRYVAKIAWGSFPEDGTPFVIAGLEVRALPVLHGADYLSFGFGFGGPGARVVYLSDYTALLPPTEALLDAWSAEPAGIALLVLDALTISRVTPVHASLEQSVDLCRRYRPAQALMVGMGEEMEHGATNTRLRRLMAEEGLDVQLARDGQLVPLALRSKS